MAITYLQWTGATQAELVAKKARKGAELRAKRLGSRHFKWRMLDERGKVISDPDLYRKRRDTAAAENRRLRESGVLPPKQRRYGLKAKSRKPVTLAIVNLPPVD